MSLGAQSDAMLAASADFSRVALMVRGVLHLRDATGAWTSATFCPVGYDQGPAAMAFTPQGKLLVLSATDRASYSAPDPYLLYVEP